MNTDTPSEPTCYGLNKLVDEPTERIETLQSLVPSNEDTEQKQEIFKALANEDRIRILEILREGERCVCELQAALEAPQSTVATHLRKLKDAGLVKSRKQGTWRLYRTADTAAFELLNLAEAMRDDE
ncbi:ArsR/SmtB family transcription factor [Halocatena pleomorpha]|nr:metalloregulator ArsR/SmtB family transcription factor [Halocatena pleomorpha]